MISGFSKLSLEEKINAICNEYKLPLTIKDSLLSHHHPNLQETYNQFSENTVSNFYIPYGIAPNFTVNGKEYSVPMAIEESSVVAAASKAAKFWSTNGGFKTQVLSTQKVGQLFFKTDWAYEAMLPMMPEIHQYLKNSVKDLSKSMESRGGGIIDMELNDEYDASEGTYSLLVNFETVDSMGANFINSCLEQMGQALPDYLIEKDSSKNTQIIMAILSNYTPKCLVECSITCDIDKLSPYSGIYSPQEFAQRFKTAVDLATHNTYRAVTHNKGIMNGIDAVALATGNDFRAIEAGVHAYACRNGKYSSLSKINIDKHTFTYSLTLPLAIGTVGGLTQLHPLANISLALLGKPGAHTLMQIMAAAGMANNFSAVAALVTSGIQKGHMKMHLSNILSSLQASEDEKSKATIYFVDKYVNYSSVRQFLDQSRKKSTNSETIS
jgi:hydroxymethylglutaryl-CoA reductase